MDLGLQGKTALVLGGSKGLGRGVADALAAEGVAVALLARGKEALDQAVAQIKGRGGRAIAVPADLADWPGVERAANTARQQLGPIDILLNNSGGPPPTRVIGIAPEVWEAQFRSMVLVFFRLTDLLLPDMRQRKWGRIINVASESVIQPIPHIAISNTLRASVVGWAKTLAGEVAHDGITVNTMLPGAFDTDITKAWDPAVKVAAGQLNPMGRIGQPGDMVGVCIFLASDASSYVNGAQILVDGGAYRTL